MPAFEQDRGFAVKPFATGKINSLAPITEADFFRHLIDRRVLERLAGGYHACPRLLRSGGLSIC